MTVAATWSGSCNARPSCNLNAESLIPFSDPNDPGFFYFDEINPNARMVHMVFLAVDKSSGDVWDILYQPPKLLTRVEIRGFRLS